MGLDLTALLDVRFYQAFDVGPDGRVLAGGDDSGSTQLIEIAADGNVHAAHGAAGPVLRAVWPGLRSPSWSPHDDGGNERSQLSVLRLSRPDGRPAGFADLEPLAFPRYMHTLADVRDGRPCYFTNRRERCRLRPGHPGPDGRNDSQRQRQHVCRSRLSEAVRRKPFSYRWPADMPENLSIAALRFPPLGSRYNLR